MVHVAWGLVLATGKDQEFSSAADTAFLSLGAKPALIYSLTAFEHCVDIEGVAVVVRKERMAEVQGLVQLFGFSKVKKIAAGKSQRLASVRSGLNALDEEVSLVVVHEASRPCVTPELIAESVKAAKRYGAAVAAVPIADTVKTVPKGHKVTGTLDPNTVWAAQTPQAFRTELLRKALENAAKKKLSLPDEAAAVERMRKDVYVVPSTAQNIKISSPDDLDIATAVLRL